MYKAVLFGLSCTKLYCLMCHLHSCNFLVYHVHSYVVWGIMYTAVFFGVLCTQLYLLVYHLQVCIMRYQVQSCIIWYIVRSIMYRAVL